MKTLNLKLPLILVVSIFIISLKTYSQSDFIQDYTDDYSFESLNGICNSCNKSNLRFWPVNNIPFANSPVKIVRIDFNVLQDGGGGGNFINDPVNIHVGTTRLNNIRDYINIFYDRNPPNNMPPAGVTVNDLPKEFIQFELGNIYFYNDPYYYKSVNATELLNLVKNDSIRDVNARDKRIQIFFTEGFKNGSVKTISVTNGGSGYTSAPTVVFNPPSTTKATVQISGGQVDTIIIDLDALNRPLGGSYGSSSGSLPNYGVPYITLTGGGGTGATAEVFEMKSAAASASAPTCTPTDKSYIISYGTYHKTSPEPIREQGDWASATTLSHELGHNLDLLHTYSDGAGAAYCTSNSSDPEYLDDVFGLPAPGNCPHFNTWDCALLSVANKIDNNMMGGNQCAGYFSPKQIGTMHRALKFKSVRKYLKDCYYDALNPLSINSSETWDFDVLWDKDINIQNGATVNLTCKLSMPQTSNITVEAGAILNIDGIITNNCDNGWNGTIHVKPGGILNLKANADITFIGNGKILIDDDVINSGLLTIEGTPKVYLDGNNSMIDIRGKVDIKNNSTFSFFHRPGSSNHGFIKFANTSLLPSRNITAGINCNIIFTGSTQSKKVLQIDQETFYAPPGIVNFTISTGKVELAFGARIQADGLNTNINLYNAKFTSTTPGVNNGHRGFHLYGQPNVSISSCVFEYGSTGIYGFLTYGGAPLNIYSTTFRNNTNGVVVNDKGCNLYSCTFFENQYGFSAENMSFPSVSDACTFNGNIVGSYWNSSNASLAINNGVIQYNTTGVKGEYASLGVTCSNISYNDTGLKIGVGASLIMNSKSKVIATGNNYTIQALRANNLNLTYGNNDLTPSSLYNQSVINGTVLTSATVPPPSSNKWNSAGTFSSND